MAVISDDIGSFPLPAGVGKECISVSDADFEEAVTDAMIKKVLAGIDAPNYPQFRDMIDSFYAPIEAHSDPEEPFVVMDEFAAMPEIDVLCGSAFREKTKRMGIERINLRACITGPLELYANRIGLHIENDLLHNIARSIGKFVSRCIVDDGFMKTAVISIDEPSFGLNPNMSAEDDGIIRAWNTAIEPAKKKGIDVQIHLHSANKIEAVYDSDINVLGVESAENPVNLDAFQKKDLDAYDKFLRVGIARSNIFGLLMDVSAETPEVIGARLEKAYGLFGDRIKYAGPDCGLGAWPSQDAASKLLECTVKAVGEFNGRLHRMP